MTFDIGVYIENTLRSFIKLVIIEFILKIHERTNSTISKLNDEIKN